MKRSNGMRPAVFDWPLISIVLLGAWTSAPAIVAQFMPTDASELISAINTANTNGEADVIDLGGLTITLTALNNSADGATGLPGLANDHGTLVIRNGAIRRSAASGFRLLRVAAEAAVLLEDLVLDNGQAGPNPGGAIHNRGYLTLRRVSLLDNAATSGGAIYNNGNAILWMHDSLATGNSAANGGALTNAPGAIVAELTNSTLSGNIATGNGGALFNSGDIESLFNCTITRNTANAGGGIAGNALPILEVRSTIIAENTAPFEADVDDVGVVAESMNLIGINSNSAFASGAPNANASWVGTVAAPIDPGLELLAENGGPTATHALEPNSLAFDHGANPLALAFDQRGDPFARTLGASTDIGAYEYARDVFRDGFE